MMPPQPWRYISVQVEVNLDGNFNPNRVTIFHGRLELPRPDSLDGLFVEAHAEAILHANIAGTAIGSHYQSKGADALIFRFTSFFGEFRLGLINGPRRTDSATHMENTAAGAAAFTRAKTGALARSYAAAASGTD